MVRKFIPVILVLAVILAACGGGAPTGEPDVVVVAMNPQFSNAPFFIAIEEGYFAEQNIEIQVENITSSREALALIVNGDVDVISGNINAALINLLAAEPNIRVVTNKGSFPQGACPYSALYGETSLVDSGAFNSPEQVRDLVFEGGGTQSLYFFLHLWLTNRHGLTLDDMQFQEVPDEVILDAIDTGAIHWGSAQEPVLSRLLASGKVKIIESYGDMYPGLEFSYVLFGAELMAENRDLGNRFMVAFMKAVRQIAIDGKSDHNVEVLARATGLDAEEVRSICWVGLNSTGDINFESVQAYQDFIFGFGDIDVKLSEEQYWDSSFVEYANEVLGPP